MFLPLVVWLTVVEKRFVSKNSGPTKYRFSVPGDGCGTEPVAEKQNFGRHNVLIFRTERNAQVWENSKNIQCLLFPDWPAIQILAFKALLIFLHVENEEQQDIRTEVLIGTGLGGPLVEQNTRLKIGDPLTFVFHVHKDYTDMFIKNCFASDGLTERVQLTDSNGCPLRPKLMQAFKRVDNVLQATMTAFRIAETTTLSLTCQVELCHEVCSNLTACTLPPALPFSVSTTNTTVAENSFSSHNSTIDSVQLPSTTSSAIPSTAKFLTQRETIPQNSFFPVHPTEESARCRPPHSQCLPSYG